MKVLRNQIINQLNIADDFYEAYERCFETDKNNHIVAIPGFVCGLFAAELYFKILICNNLKNNKVNQIHDLYELFNLLTEEQKSHLKSIHLNFRCNLEFLLKEIGNGFVTWRYIFEDGNEDFGSEHPFEFSQVFLKTYLYELKEMATNIKLS